MPEVLSETPKAATETVPQAAFRKLPRPGRLLFILELANNHGGSLEHGLSIVREMGEVARRFPEFDFGLKFQYRDLDTFIHPAYRDRMDIKYVKRFSQTRLSDEDFLALKAAAEREGFLSICTPFDEPSVDRIAEQGFAVAKIASCSFTDWPLLERVARTRRPVVASTAGATLEDIDRVVSFFEHREIPLVLMHCVAQYPTAPSDLKLGQIDLFRSRYPHVTVGYSTHEPPDTTAAIQIAIAKGALVFEKHVDLATSDHTPNGYSATPAQVERWLAAARSACAMTGATDARTAADAEELSSLHALRRGVFARRPLRAGDRIAAEDVYLAFPAAGGQLTANHLSKYAELYAEAAIEPDAPLLGPAIRVVDTRDRVYEIVQRVKAFLEAGHVAVPRKVELELSHHYGLERFDEVGATMITVVNREYCKKLIVLLPGQSHPEQYHLVKEETFHVVHGGIDLSLNGVGVQCQVGDVVTIERGVHHAFSSQSGAVIEEISSTHARDDSYYVDEAIGRNAGRKTRLTYWL